MQMEAEFNPHRNVSLSCLLEARHTQIALSSSIGGRNKGEAPARLQELALSRERQRKTVKPTLEKI